MTRMLVLVINPGMMLVPRVLPTVLQDQPYSVTLEVLDEQPPVKLRIVAGTLPAGLTFVDNGDGTAAIAGTTSAAEGFFEITVEFEDVRQDPRQHTYRGQVVVVPVPPVPVVVSGTAPAGQVGVPYTYTFTATGGDGGPYTWGIASGSLPPGITLNASTGTISGTPTTDAGSPFGFSVYATDGDGNVSSPLAQSVVIDAVFIAYVDDFVSPYLAWSATKKLIRAATVAMRIRRSSDNAEMDIGFVAGAPGSQDVVDWPSILAFVGAGSGYVVKFYDQTGGGKLADAPSTAQPRIVNAGVADSRAIFDGINDTMGTSSHPGGLGSAEATLFTRARFRSDGSGAAYTYLYGGYVSHSGGGFQMGRDPRVPQGGPGISAAVSSGGAANYVQEVVNNAVVDLTTAVHNVTVSFDLSAGSSAGKCTIYADGISYSGTVGASGNPTGTLNNNNFILGSYSGGIGAGGMDFESLVLVASDVIADQADVEALL